MSLQSANEFVLFAAKHPAITEESNALTANKSADEAALAISKLGKREGFDFTPAESLEIRLDYIQALSEADLDSVSGGKGEVSRDQLIFAGSVVGGSIAPGGSIIGAGAGAAIDTALGGGSASDALAAGALEANKSLNESKSVVEKVFSGW